MVRHRYYHPRLREPATNVNSKGIRISAVQHFHSNQGEVAQIQTQHQDQIDKKTLDISQADDETYTKVQDIADELPDHAPRFVLLSYPLTLASGRLSVPYVMLYYLPVTTNAEMRMLYAGAKELMRNTAEVNKIIEITEAEDLEDIEEKLKGDA
ncbi:glia maturation factor beta [Venturia nashicola]|nr:glia maturation factor beta [Venturia nashicola]